MKASNPTVSPSLPKVPIARLVGHDGPVQVVQFSANGKYCWTGGHDRTVRLWNPLRIDPAFPPPPLPTISNNNNNNHQDGITADALARALPIQTYGQGYTHPITAVAVDDKSTTLAAASHKTVVITDVMTQQVKRRFQGHLGMINAVAVSQGSETFLSASYDGTCRIWDGRSHSYEPIMILKDANDSVTDVHVVQDGDGSNKNSNVNNNQALLRTASVDGCVRTYDIRQGQLSVDDCHSPITSVTPTRDGQCLVVNCLDGTLRLYELASGELLNTFAGSHTAGQYGLQCQVTANDATVVTGSEDGRVVLYDMVRSTAVQTLQGPTKPTCAVACHPKPDFTSVLVAASYDGSCTVWGHDEGFMKWRDE